MPTAETTTERTQIAVLCDVSMGEIRKLSTAAKHLAAAKPIEAVLPHARTPAY